MAKAKKLPSGNWRIQASKTVDGVVYKKSFTDADRRRVERAAIDWQTDLNNTCNIENITLDRAYERYIKAKENILSPSTIRNYKKLHQNHLQDIMNISVSKLTNEIIQRSINIYSANHSPKSVRNCYGLLSAVIKMFNPGLNLHITLPQKEKKEPYIPTDEIIQEVMHLAKNTKLYRAIVLAAFGGMREGEICALDSNDIIGTFINVNKSMVCDSNGKWHIKAPKTFSSNRKVEMPDFVINEFKGITGKIVPYNPHSLSMTFNKFLKKNNLPHFRFHDLRHYYVSSLHALNIPDKYIMAQGGWATNYTMQNVYNHTMADKRTEFSSRITTHFETFIQ